MSIPNSQLEIWSHQGAVTTSKNTYASIKHNLEKNTSLYANKDFNVYLQGSYGNDTNIRSDSDVDVVIQLNSTFHRDISDLSEDQVRAYKSSYDSATYHLSEFKKDILSHLKDSYGLTVVDEGKKSIKLLGNSGRLNADVIVCCQYRDYHWFRSLSDQKYVEGIYFISTIGEIIVNYPKLHSENCTEKHKSTNNSFKPIVRIFKNMRSRLVSDGLISKDLAPSYFIEGLIYNIPEDRFNGSYEEAFCNCINWLLENDRSKFVTPSKKHWLFGDSSVQWTDSNCSQFLDALVKFWNEF